MLTTIQEKKPINSDTEWNDVMKFGDELIDISGQDVTLARVISRLTPAPLINLYVGIIMSIFPPDGLGPNLTAISSIMICIVLMVILPVVPIFMEAMKGKVDLDVSTREMRTRFFLWAILCYIIAYGIYAFFQCDIMRILAGAYITVTTGVLIATQFSKVSVHGAGIGGPGSALIYVYGLLATPVVLVWMIVIWSRTKLQQHSIRQSIMGVAIGIIITTITYWILYV